MYERNEDNMFFEKIYDISLVYFLKDAVYNFEFTLFTAEKWKDSFCDSLRRLSTSQFTVEFQFISQELLFLFLSKDS